MERAELKKYDLPDVPGVYFFKQGRKILYVGKATSLRDRVRSYFDDDLIATRGPRIVDMVTRADGLAYEPTPTVLEALVREAVLIKKHMPPANSDGKDDSTFLYAVITKEDIPRVLVVRGKDLDFKNRRIQGDALKATSQGVALRAIFGPYPSGPQLREGLRLIRRIFPFFDTEKPVIATNKHHRAKIEFNTQIGQYPRDYDRKQYLKSIRNVTLFLAGRGKELRKTLMREMTLAAREERFEDAATARRQLFALDHIQDVSLIKDESRETGRYPQKSAIAGNSGYRIEAYDTAHLAGTNAVGVMTVLIDGVPAKKDYRTFRIRGGDFVSPGAKGLTKSKHGRNLNNDIASLREILSRRLGHPEWELPSAIVVDGGKPQKKAAEAVLADAGISIPVAAVVKDERHRPREVIGARLAGVTEVDAVRANAEAHRFSLARHRRARSRGLRG